MFRYQMQGKEYEFKEIIPSGDEIDCTYFNDVTYVSRDGVDLKLQIITPYNPMMQGKRFPLVVFVQGSAWFKQNCYINVPQLARFAQRGYVAAIVEYRPSGISPFPAQVQDAKTAIRFLRKNADKFGINPEQVFIWGDSSGGHTAVLAGLTCNDNIFDTDDYKEFSCSVKGIIDYYGVTDITDPEGFPSTQNHQKPDSPEGLFIGGKDVNEHPELAQPTIAMNHISKEKLVPPVLIFHGTSDKIVSFGQSVKLYEKLISCGKKVDFYAINGADHGGPAFWSKQVLDIVEAFINENK